MHRPRFDPSTDYYGLLDVPQHASTSDIQAAYRRLAKAYHPDLNAGSPRAAARMARLNVAKSVLLDPTTRSAYDAARSMRFGPRTLGGASASGHVSTVTARAYAAPIFRTASVGAKTSPGRVVSPPSPSERKGGFDRQTLLLLAMVFPFLAAIAFYLADGVLVASQPPPEYNGDLALAPSKRPTAESLAKTAYMVAANHAPGRRLGQTIYNITHSQVDPSPEASIVRSIGRRMREAGLSGNADAWYRAVGDLCRMAGEC